MAKKREKEVKGMLKIANELFGSLTIFKEDGTVLQTQDEIADHFDGYVKNRKKWQTKKESKKC